MMVNIGSGIDKNNNRVMLVAKIIHENEIDVLHCVNNKQLKELYEDGYLEYIQTGPPSCKKGDKANPIYQKTNNKIMQSWIVTKDNQAIINNLKEKLSSSDYKVTKCMEAQLLSNPLPYDINELYTERQQIRDKINELEILINNG